MPEPDVREAAGRAPLLWWVWVLFGIAWVFISLVILQFTSASVATVGLIVGVFFLVAAVQEFLMAAVVRGWKWLWVVFGVLFAAAGVLALVFPKNTFAAIADMLGFLFLLVGVFWIMESFATRETNEAWWINLTAGILMVILAFWTGGQFFITKAYTLVIFAGVWAMLRGITDVIKAFQIRKYGRMTVA